MKTTQKIPAKSQAPTPTPTPVQPLTRDQLRNVGGGGNPFPYQQKNG